MKKILLVILIFCSISVIGQNKIISEKELYSNVLLLDSICHNDTVEVLILICDTTIVGVDFNNQPFYDARVFWKKAYKVLYTNEYLTLGKELYSKEIIIWSVIYL